MHIDGLMTQMTHDVDAFPRPAGEATPSAPAPGPRDDALEAVHTRYTFLRFGAQILLKTAFLQGAANLVLSGVVVVLLATRPQPPVIMVGPDGRAIAYTPLNQPTISDSQVIDYAARWAADCATMGFRDYQLRLEQCRQHFTDSGYRAFLTGLRDARAIDALKANYAMQTAAARGAGVIVRKGITTDRAFQWTVQIPMIKTAATNGGETNREFLLEVDLIRLSELDRLPAIAIAAWREN